MADHVRDLVEQNGPRFARPPESGRPCPSRGYGHGPAWLVLAVALVLLIVGTALPDGLLIAAGLAVAGLAGHLFEPREGHSPDRSSRRLRRPRHGSRPARPRPRCPERAHAVQYTSRVGVPRIPRRPV